MAAERYMNAGELNSLLSVQGQNSINAERQQEAVETLKQRIEEARTKAEDLIKDATEKHDFKDPGFQSRIMNLARKMKVWNEALPETERVRRGNCGKRDGLGREPGNGRQGVHPQNAERRSYRQERNGEQRRA